MASAASESDARETGALALDPLDGLDEARAEWTELALSGGNVFATWDWAATWWEHFGAGRQLALTGCRRPDGRLVGILPLCRRAHGPLRTLRFVGHGVADRLGPVCATEDRPAVAAALARQVSARKVDWDVFLAERLPADEPWAGALGGRLVRREPSPVLRIDGLSWADFVASRSRNFREQVRRRERRLARDHELRFRLADDPRRLDADLALLLGLHRARWGQESSGFAAERAPFHRAFAHRALERGWLRLWIAEIDGRPAAAWYGLRFGGAEWYYQAGRDPAWDRASVGFVLLVHSIREAFADGMREYKFLLGEEPFKARFANADESVDTLAVGRGALGRAAPFAIAAARRLPPGVKRRLLRRAG